MNDMLGEQIVARTIEQTRVKDRQGRSWQYHSRSDRHSKAACWAIMFDLLRISPLVQKHAESGKIGFGINHEMCDYRVNRKKNLDLVVCRGAPVEDGDLSFIQYGQEIGIVLDSSEARELDRLPVLRRGLVSTVLIALEAKACMTEHIKARPRLYDELLSSEQTVHGDTKSAIAAAFIMINCATEFVSPGRNKTAGRKVAKELTSHRQPDVALRVLEKVMELPRRSDERDSGFDSVGITMIDCRNDGSPVRLAEAINRQVDRAFRYEELIRRLAHLYATKFKEI